MAVPHRRHHHRELSRLNAGRPPRGAGFSTDRVATAGIPSVGGHAGAVGRYLQAAADLALGWCCAGCGLPGIRLCPDCLAAFDRPARQHRDPCPAPVVAAAEYRGAARRVLAGYKLGGMWSLATPLGWCLARAVPLLEPPPVLVLVPVPSAPSTVRRRGLDTTAALARSAGRALARQGVDATVLGALRRQRGIREQVGLDARQRRQNLTLGLTVRRPEAVAGWTVLVIDDILTTGATAGAAVSALRSAGAAVLGVAVVAHTARPGG